MGLLAKVLWRDGQYLNPHDMQCQDRHLDDRLLTLSHALHPFPWGVRYAPNAQLSKDLNALSLTSFDVVLPAGEYLRTPETAVLPPPLRLDSLPASWDSCVVSIEVPPHSQKGSNCSVAGIDTKRYVKTEERIVDELFDTPTELVQFAVYSPLLSAGPDADVAFGKLPLLRLRRTITGEYSIDDTFIAPSVTIRASPALFRRLENLLTVLGTKARALADENAETVRETIAFRAGDHASFWLLHTISSSAASLGHLLNASGASPERLHQELARLAGGLMAFSRSVKLSDLPRYRHDAPDETFSLLFSQVTRLVDTVIPTMFISIALEKDGASYLSGQIITDKIDNKATLYLGVSAGAIGQDVAAEVPARLKIGAPDDVEKAVTSALACVHVKHVAVPPASLPIKPGYTYFVLDSRGDAYDRMLKSSAVRIFRPSGLDGLALELFAVTT